MVPGGIEHYLSSGRGEGYPEGKGFKKCPEYVKTFIDALPASEIPAEYVIFKPLEEVKDEETPQAVCFLVNPDQLTALVGLANYGRPTLDNVIIPSVPGCQAIALLPFHEAKQDRPRAVVGMADVYIRHMFPPELLSFTVPHEMFLEME